MVAQQLAVVTGASSGIGRATALQLAASGWRVVGIARRGDRLAELARRAAAVGSGHLVVEVVDGADALAVQAMADRVLERYGVPGALVHCAGAGEWRWPEETPPRDMERMLDAPFRSAYHVTHAFLAEMLHVGSGVIVHVGSPVSFVAWPSATGYAISRWALRGFHEALVQDLHGTGLHSCHVVFAEVTSEYFAANPGTAERRPTVGRLMRTISLAEAAEVVVRTLHRPRPLVLHPLLLRTLPALLRVAPELVRSVVRVTGRHR